MIFLDYEASDAMIKFLKFSTEEFPSLLIQEIKWMALKFDELENRDLYWLKKLLQVSARPDLDKK